MDVIIEDIVLFQANKIIVYLGSSNFEIPVVVDECHPAPVHQYRQVTDVNREAVEQAFGEIDYDIFVPALPTSFIVDTYNSSSSSNEHLFHMSQPFKTMVQG